MDYIKEIAEAMSANHAAVMIGAGFSKNADKISSTDKWFKNWNELSDMFYETVYGNAGPGKEYNSSLRLAQEVEITVGRPKLENILKEAVPDEDYGPSEVYTKLMELPWRDVFTTNYDTLLERAADKVSKRRYNVVVNQEDLVNSNDAPRILKLHGSFPSQRPFIITEEDYRTYPIKFAAMVNTVQQALLENVFCMIGFSCEDPNFLSWIGWIHDNLGKSSSQKIYMISIEHISEAKQKLLFDKNIIVVDLQELYPEKEIPERLKSFFENLRKLIEEKDKKDQWFDLTNIDRKNDQQTAFQIEERSKQSYRIAVGLLLLKIKKKEIISIEEKEVIEEYFKTLQEYYNASNVLEFIEKLLLEKLNISEDIYTNMEEKLWLHSEEDINLLQIFYLETSRIKIDIKQMKRFGTFSNMVYQMAIYRIINTEISNVMPVLRLLYALVVNNIIVERETKLLFINLPRLMKDTTIGVEDFEKEARHKLNCRREICVIVSEYYKKGERNNNVLEWMELTKNSNEFVEIRNIEFE